MEIENLPEEESSNADDVDVPSVYRDCERCSLTILTSAMTGM